LLNSCLVSVKCQTRVEDYLPAGNALGYNENWQYRHTGGELLMMGATGEPSGYYPMDSNGLVISRLNPPQDTLRLIGGELRVLERAVRLCERVAQGRADGQSLDEL